ncbi:MAG: polyphosphate kinase 2 family protein [Ethanoligenens sp.]
MKTPGIFRFDGAHSCHLWEVNPSDTGSFQSKEETLNILEKNKSILAEEQNKLYAQKDYAILVILQGLDAAGKDGIIRHVFSGLNPEGVKVWSFKQPSSEELQHDYLWRTHVHMPERGQIGIFNRSYYEEVLVVRVHDLLPAEHIPAALTDNIWEKRYRHIGQFEEYLCENGILPVKFFLHVSKEEQKNRLLSRLEDPAKNWKFSTADVKERSYWNKYQACYEEIVNNTSSRSAPWYIIPSDKKWYARYLISHILVNIMQGLHLQYPTTTPEQGKVLNAYRELLQNGTGEQA